DGGDGRALQDRARGGVGADAFPGGVGEHRVGRGGERALKVHALSGSGPSGPRSLLGGGTRGPAPRARAAASPTLVDRIARFTRVVTRRSCKPQSLSTSASARSARMRCQL